MFRPSSNPEVRELQTVVQRLEDRIRSLEQALAVTSSQVVLSKGSSRITLTSREVEISASSINAKATGDVVIKGQKIADGAASSKAGTPISARQPANFTGGKVGSN